MGPASRRAAPDLDPGSVGAPLVSALFWAPTRGAPTGDARVRGHDDRQLKLSQNP